MGWATSMITLSGGARPTVGIYSIVAVVAAVAAEVSVIEQNTKSMSETKKYRVTQQKDANAIIARRTTATEFNVQVERPPKFTMLPLGASKLAKNRKTNLSAKEVNTPEGGGGGGGGGGNEDDVVTATTTTAQHIRKEKQEMEEMRERVMKQYAILRESRGGSRSQGF
jgi:hypothetical protein